MALFGRAQIMGGRQTQGTSLPAAILALGPLGYWKLQETSGTTATDSSGNGRNGTYDESVGGLSLAAVAGPDGGNYPDFGSSNPGWVLIADNNVWSANTASGLSVFALIKPDSVSSTQARNIISKGNTSSQFEWAFSINAGVAGRLTYITWNAAGTTCRRIDVDTVLSTNWQAVCGTIESPTTTATPVLYRDGSDIGGTLATSGGTPYANGTAAVRIGWRDDQPAFQFFQGSLAHVALFAGELNSTQVGTLMSAADADGWY